MLKHKIVKKNSRRMYLYMLNSEITIIIKYYFKVLEFAVLVFSSAIVSWSDRGSLCLALGLTDHTFSSRGCNEDMILNTLPLALQNLMNANSWKSLGPKVCKKYVIPVKIICRSLVS